MAAFILQGRVGRVVKEMIWPTKLLTFTIWPLREKVLIPDVGHPEGKSEAVFLISLLLPWGHSIPSTTRLQVRQAKLIPVVPEKASGCEAERQGG